MRLITRSCVLLLWMHTLALVKSQSCTLQQFFSGPLYDSNFDTTALEASYLDGKQVRVGCNVGYTGFFKLICKEGVWEKKGKPCEARSCGHPGDAQFADFHLQKGDDFVFGSQVVFTCQKGYQMVSRNNYRRCMAEGWDGVVPVCEAQQCPVILVDNNVHVIGDPDESTYGNVVRFTCKSRTEILDGSEEMYCDENGEWSGRVPKCKEIQCPIPNIENGVVDGNIEKYKEHDVLHFRCDDAFKRIDTRPSTCTKRGTTAEWSPTPACEPIVCRLPTTLEGTSYETTSRNVFSPGQTVKVICGRKYWISKHPGTSAVTRCKSDGEWTLRPVCQEVICQRPQNVAWSYRWHQQIRLDETVQYSCVSGYKSTDGATDATCMRNGWEPNPLCQEITCNRRDYQNSNIVRNDRRIFKYNEQVNYVCKNGYEGRFYLTCGETGWIGTEKCKKVCKKLHIDNAEITYNEKETYRLNEQVRYSCSSGAERVLIVTCEESGWTGDMSCSGCRNADVPHGFIVGPYSDTVYYTCKEGYKLATKGWWAEAKCTDGLWSGLKQCIAQTACGEIPEIPNGSVTPPRGQSKEARIACDDRYRAQVTRLTCHEGKWLSNGFSPETICTPTAVPCKPPRKVDNAVIVNSYQKEYLSESRVTYQCRDKYILLEREDTIRCKDGQWEEKNILCTPYCDKLKDVSMNFTADKERYMDGDVIEYRCVITGVEGNATCNKTEWNKSEACKGCSKLHIDNAEITHNEKETYRLNEKAHYSCRDDPGRVLIVTCEESGWTGDMNCPGCNKLHIDDAQITHIVKETYRVNEKAHYSCRDDPRRVLIVTCEESGWTGDMSCSAPNPK